MRWSVTYMQQLREVSRTRTIYSTETHTSDFILNMFWNGKPVQFFQERCCVVMTGCQENKSCSKVLNFLERLDDRIRCTHKETVAVVKLWKDVGSNKYFKTTETGLCNFMCWYRFQWWTSLQIYKCEMYHVASIKRIKGSNLDRLP